MSLNNNNKNLPLKRGATNIITNAMHFKVIFERKKEK